MSTFLYAGSFDPITKGHEWVIKNAPGNLIVAVADNPGKTHRFTMETRCSLVKQSCQGLNVKIVGLYEGEYLIDLAKNLDAHYIIRGARDAGDFAYEQAYAAVNRDINPQIPHLLMLAPPHLAMVSSSMVKSLVGYIPHRRPGWEVVVSNYVSPHVLEALRG